MTRYKKHVLGFVAVVGVALGGCATINSLFNNPVFVAGLQDAIEIGIGVVGAKYGAADVQLIGTVASEIAGVAGNSNVTLTQLVTQADALIAAKSPNADVTAALNSLVVLAMAGVQTGTNAANNANPQVLVNLQTFFTDIANAAQNLSKTNAAAAKVGFALKP